MEDLVFPIEHADGVMALRASDVAGFDFYRESRRMFIFMRSGNETTIDLYPEQVEPAWDAVTAWARCVIGRDDLPHPWDRATDEVSGCQFDSDGDGNCAMPACPVCHPENQPLDVLTQLQAGGHAMRMDHDVDEGGQELLSSFCDRCGLETSGDWLAFKQKHGVKCRGPKGGVAWFGYVLHVVREHHTKGGEVQDIRTDEWQAALANALFDRCGLVTIQVLDVDMPDDCAHLIIEGATPDQQFQQTLRLPEHNEVCAGRESFNESEAR